MAAASSLCSPRLATLDSARIDPRTSPRNAARAVTRTPPHSLASLPLSSSPAFRQRLTPHGLNPQATEKTLYGGSTQWEEPAFSLRSSPRRSPTLRVSASARPSEGNAALPAIRFRPAVPEDMGTIQRLVLSEFMNPLSLDVWRFVVAEASTTAAAEGAGEGEKRKEGGAEAGWQLVGVGQMKEWKKEGEAGTGSGPLVELRSLVVLPELRGRGIGSALVSELLKSVQGRGAVYLLTIGARTAFYERHGFNEVAAGAVPSQLQLELFLGSFVARLAAGDRCLCMKAVV